MSIPLSYNHFEGSAGSQQFIDEIAGVSWTSAVTTGEIDTTVQYKGNSSLKIAPTSAPSERQAVAQGWASPHAVDWAWESYVRWDDSSSGWLSVSIQNSAAVTAFTVQMNYAGQLAFKFIVSAYSLTEILPTAFPVTVNTWYYMGVSRNASAGQYYINWNGSIVRTITESANVIGVARVRLGNIGTSGSVWFDDWRLIPGLDFGVDLVPDSAEFDFETEGGIGVTYIIASETTFSDDGTIRCRRIVVAPCIRRKRATHDCRRMVAASTVLQ